MNSTILFNSPDLRISPDPRISPDLRISHTVGDKQVDVKKDSALYSLDSVGNLHIDKIVGVLKLSSKKINTTKTTGYVMKEFEPIFGYFPTFMVKTNRRDLTDKYVSVKISQTKNSMGIKIIQGTVDSYIGDVGDPSIEHKLCQIISTVGWNRKIDKLDWSDKNIIAKNGIQLTDLTPDRLDMTITSNKMVTVSVDPEGSRDIDDAIGISIENGCYHVAIHIADPTSYLIEDQILDKEIAVRCESVYLTQTTNHMFPEKLTTDMFSLLECSASVGQDKKHMIKRRAFSVILKIDQSYRIVEKEIKKTLVHVDRNMTYEQFQKQYNTSMHLNKMYEIGKSLYRSILDPNNLTEYNAKKMIEVFMVVCNSTVAETLVEKYQKSDPQMLRCILLRTQPTNRYVFDEKTIDRQSVGHIGKNELNKIIDEHLQLKMESAEIKFYHNDQSSNRHSQLNLGMYTYFSSPIRRYTDILVHRLLYNCIYPTSSTKFKLTILRSDTMAMHQLFLINHSRHYYKNVARLEKEIYMANHIIANIGDPSDRVINARGIVMDIHADRITVKCIDVDDWLNNQYDTMTDDPTDDDRMVDDDNISLEKTKQYFLNTLHRLRLPDSNFNRNGLKLFTPVNFKICFLRRNIKKIKAFLF
jgi:exoribonuclease R